MATKKKIARTISAWSETGAIEKSNQVDDWIAIETDGTVVAYSGKVELGTGVRTALAQIVAEELDVAVDRVRMVMGDTARTPDEGYTAGSKTIQHGGYALRQASAQARRALLELAGDQLDAAIDELVVSDGVISFLHDPSRRITYAELIGGKRFNCKISGDAPLKRPDDYHVVGTAVPRVDLPHKFMGIPSFVQDLRLPGMVHGRVVRPPGRGAKVLKLDVNSVDNAQVVRLGDFIGVVAQREEEAVRAAKTLKVEWTPSAPLPAMDELYDELRHRTVADQVISNQGRVQTALKRAVKIHRATYYQPFQAHASIGPACAVAEFRDDQLQVWCSTQGVYPLRRALADLLQMPLEKIRVIHLEGAGCYGHNGSDDVAADAAILARAAGKPVRVQWSRQDEFVWEPYAPAMVMQLRGGLDAKGQVIAWEYQAWSPTHTSRPNAALDLLAGQLIQGSNPPARQVFRGGDRNAPTVYEFSNQQVTMHWIEPSPLRASAFRSLGATANTFANESFMDELAFAARSDPLEFRLRQLRDPRAHAVLQAAAEHAGWVTVLPSGEGRGIAFIHYENECAYAAAVAHVHVDSVTGDVRVKRVVVAHDCGLVINPDGLKNQIEGNVIQSTSRALKEQVRWEQGHITSVDWDTYPILKFSEVPEVETVLINRPDQPAVGAGEPATNTTAPAIANAIFQATGARIREIPFTSKRVKAAIDSRERS